MLHYDIISIIRNSNTTIVKVMVYEVHEEDVEIKNEKKSYISSEIVKDKLIETVTREFIGDLTIEEVEAKLDVTTHKDLKIWKVARKTKKDKETWVSTINLALSYELTWNVTAVQTAIKEIDFIFDIKATQDPTGFLTEIYLSSLSETTNPNL